MPTLPGSDPEFPNNRGSDNRGSDSADADRGSDHACPDNACPDRTCADTAGFDRACAGTAGSNAGLINACPENAGSDNAPADVPMAWLRRLQDLLRPPSSQAPEAFVESFCADVRGALQGASPADTEAFNAALEALQRQAAEQIDCSNFGDGVARELGERLVSLSQAWKLEARCACAFGSLPVNLTSALMLDTPPDGVALVLPRGLLTFFNLLARIVCTFVPREETESGTRFDLRWTAIERRLEELDEANANFVDLCFTSGYLRNPLAARLCLSFDPEWRLAAAIRRQAELFTLAAQYALGVVLPPGGLTSRPLRFGEEIWVNRLEPDADSLLLGDLLGLQMAAAVASDEGTDLPLVIGGMELALGGEGLLERVQAHVLDDAPTTASIRRSCLRQSMQTRFGPTFAAAMDTGAVFDLLLQTLWSRNRREVLKRIEAHQGTTLN